MITLNYGSKEANTDSGLKIGLAALGEERSVLLGDPQRPCIVMKAHF